MSEKETASGMEIYVRFCDDMEKDYCFQIGTDAQFKELLKIFTSLPISLRPNVFYDQVPQGFVVLTAPGYLTEDGALLFSYETDQDRFRKKVALSDIVSESCWPGQLVLPVWKFNSFAFYSFVAFLATWLYTDLPDFISPTPGHCLTNYTSKFMASVGHYYGYHELADRLLADVLEEVGIGAQLIFFAFHIFKLAGIFFIVYGGLFNPVKILHNPFASQPEVTRDALVELGWTGSKRGNADEYKDHFREVKIKEYGGMVAAHQAGLFTKLKKLGVFLGEGEGYNTPLSSDTTFADIKSDKFVLSYGYFVKLGEHFERHVKDKEGDEISAAIKEFRRYGLLSSSEEISAVVEARKAVGDAKLS